MSSSLSSTPVVMPSEMRRRKSCLMVWSMVVVSPEDDEAGPLLVAVRFTWRSSNTEKSSRGSTCAVDMLPNSQKKGLVSLLTCWDSAHLRTPSRTGLGSGLSSAFITTAKFSTCNITRIDSGKVMDYIKSTIVPTVKKKNTS